MNRQQRRAAATKQRKSFNISIRGRHTRFDIQVEGKDHDANGAAMPTPLVMIMANARGRKIVEDLWPPPGEVWARGVMFEHEPPDWQFTHVVVTQLPQHLAEVSRGPGEDSGDALACAVTMALAAFAEPMRVAHWVGHAEDGDVQARIYDSSKNPEARSRARELQIEYVPATKTVEGTA
jgi:hypothetical protein